MPALLSAICFSGWLDTLALPFVPGACCSRDMPALLSPTCLLLRQSVLGTVALAFVTSLALDASPFLFDIASLRLPNAACPPPAP